MSGVAVLTLALGIALNSSVLAVVNAYLWRGLPYPGSERLHSIRYLPGDPLNTGGRYRFFTLFVKE